MKIISTGEILWDVFENAEHLGGAPFNFSAHLHRLGHEVLFVSAVGADERGRRALQRVRELGLSTRYIRSVESAETGVVAVTLDSGGQPRYHIQRPAAYDFPALPASLLAEISSPPADWIYFGTLQQQSAAAKAVTRALIDANPAARRFYDVNLRPDSFHQDLVCELLSLGTVVKLNETETEAVADMAGLPHRSIREFSEGGRERFGWEGVCVTRGERGCVLHLGSGYTEAHGYPVKVADAVGAGDAFAAAFLHGLGAGLPLAEVADFANRVGALVAGRAGAIPDWTIAEAAALEAR